MAVFGTDEVIVKNGAVVGQRQPMKSQPVTVDNSGNITTLGIVRSQQPHLHQSDSTTQSITNTSNAQIITFNTDVHSDGITRTSSSRFTIIETGSYLLSISALLDTTSAGKHGEIWLRVDGSDVADSNTRVHMPANSEQTLTVSFIQRLIAGCYFEFWFWGDHTSVRLLATGVGSTPTRPAVPSIIMIAKYVASD